MVPRKCNPNIKQLNKAVNMSIGSRRSSPELRRWPLIQKKKKKSKVSGTTHL